MLATLGLSFGALALESMPARAEADDGDDRDKEAAPPPLPAGPLPSELLDSDPLASDPPTAEPLPPEPGSSVPRAPAATTGDAWDDATPPLLLGDGHDEWVAGEGGDLHGSDGSDALTGGAGDHLHGGAGADGFGLALADLGGGADGAGPATIHDFDAADDTLVVLHDAAGAPPPSTWRWARTAPPVA